jgi:hypothetical protein
MATRDPWFLQDVPPGELAKLPTDLSSGHQEMVRTRDRRIAAMEAVMACLLDHYLAAYDGCHDALATEAAELVPNWRTLRNEWQPKYPKE